MIGRYRLIAPSGGGRVTAITLGMGQRLEFRETGNRYGIIAIYNEFGSQLGFLDPVPYVCPVCGQGAPYGDERLMWLDIHESVLHRVWWSIKRRFRWL